MRPALRHVWIPIIFFQFLVMAPLHAQVGGDNPKPFDRFEAPTSSPIQFIFSDTGRKFLRSSSSPLARDILQAMGEEMPEAGPMIERAPESRSEREEQAPCENPAGTVFNLEPRVSALPQNEVTVDFLYNGAGDGVDLVAEGTNDFRGFRGGLGFSATGYYVRRANNDCGPQFEGGLPTIVNPFDPTRLVFGGGDPVTAADSGRNAMYMADIRSSFFGSVTGIGVFRSAAATLLDPSACPDGTHTGGQAATCWPNRMIVNPLPKPFQLNFNDKPHLTVDERTSGTGAGNVYVTAMRFDFTTFSSSIWLVSCKNDLSACSSAQTISALEDRSTQFSHVSVRPDGRVTVTYGSFSLAFDGGTFHPVIKIRYVTCAPADAPASPSCSSAVTAFAENQPLFTFAGSNWRAGTYPKHDHRTSDGGTETFVVWDRCKIGGFNFGFGCPDADVVMVSTNDDGATWSPLTPVNDTLGNQFAPWIKTDRSTNTVKIVYYAAVDKFNHLLKVQMQQILPGERLPKEPFFVTQAATEPDLDPFLAGRFFGDYIGLAARGTTVSGQPRVYSGYTYTTRKGLYSGVASGQQDNFIKQIMD